MPELVDKIELKEKVRALHDCGCDDEFTRGFYWAVDECVAVIDRAPTIPDIDRAAILRLCNEIEEIVTAIANWSENWQTVDDCRTVCDKLKEIGKELTGDAGKTD